MSINNNTFLSRIFGANSYYPNDEEALENTELSLFNPVSDEFTNRFAPQPRLYLESEAESDSDSDGLLNESRTLPSGTNERDKTPTRGSVAPTFTTPSLPATSTNPKGPPLFGILNSRYKAPETAPVNEQDPVLPTFQTPARRRKTIGFLSNREKALWMWANVENLDIFLQDLYKYYLGNGFQCMMLSKTMDLFTLIFVIWFSGYISSCVDYSKIAHSKSLAEIRIPQCYAHMNPLKKFFGFIMFAYVVVRVIQVYNDYYRLLEVRNFYNHLLMLEDDELTTISWQQVVAKITLVADANGVVASSQKPPLASDPTKKQELNALDIVNRIMRKENYMIGLFNKKILDLSLPVPSFLSPTNKTSHQFLTKTLEWNLNLCIINFIFTERGQIHPKFLAERNRQALTEDLRKRFFIAGFLNLALAPFIVTYFILLYFFRYFNEYKTNPGNIASARQYTPIAEWELREFNELYHFFRRRLNLSCEVADEYVLQFPSAKTHIIMKFVAFVTGSVVAVLAVFTLIDPDGFLNFEITVGRNVLFYISIFGTIWAVSRNSLPKENLVFDPEHSMRRLCEYTHYMPAEWEGRLHTVEVRNEFTSKYYDLEVVLLLKELASLVLTPFILWYQLTDCSAKIIDFVREFTIHVDGLGYVCYFAMFDFEKKMKKQRMFKARSREAARAIPKDIHLDDDFSLREDYYSTNNDKMMKSYMHFVDSYGGNPKPGKVPPPQSSGKPDLLNRRKPSKLRELAVANSTTGHLGAGGLAPLESIPREGGMNDSLLEGSYQLNLNNFQGHESESYGGNSGVLKMLHQFYKPADIGR
ncbi:hypothetical protein BABINDRAFT_162717 [Babjeviella inositovora NRRL Y-12698]|uniref:Autophagy-related protein 9 n=1 Tax=Babjeviella inositovora NRRL Y-12698 TaxID=984486 RepID=A0A1E3QN43_9ASCO|nr:uncharacterized protein BABINDRAFT_162717 [Babjeviella inositovora NRRL Y-12698]ODQ78512.1 hypothetical protein BABINDRAFT_162717 [Babjeviella inositovora NRRL Y-12698]